MVTTNKAARTALGKETINKLIPAILSSNPRAQTGVQSSRLFRGSTDLPKLSSTLPGHHGPHKLSTTSDAAALSVCLVQSDTLDAARALRLEHPTATIAVLNMASPLQPGGGVLRGSTAQEESLCLRSTLYPSLRPEWYRHPSDAVIYTPNVLVFRSSATPAMAMLAGPDRFYVDVISCAAARHPETVEVTNGKGEKDSRYADPQDEELMSLKIKYIMRTAARMGVTHLVLGAWGCGAYGNPVGQVAHMMRKCLVGKGRGRPAEEDWHGAGIEHLVFAILDQSPSQRVWQTFVDAFRDCAEVATK